MCHAALGVSSEAGEIAGIIQKYYQGHAIDIADLLEEIGDELWFLAELSTAFGISLDDCAKLNVKKLQKRYSGEGFTSEESIERVDHKEKETER